MPGSSQTPQSDEPDRCCWSVKPAGTVVVANLTCSNDEVAYMEAVMDWWMQYRDLTALEDLAGAAQENSNELHISTYSRCENRVGWLCVTRDSNTGSPSAVTTGNAS